MDEFRIRRTARSGRPDLCELVVGAVVLLTWPGTDQDPPAEKIRAALDAYARARRRAEFGDDPQAA